MFYVSSLKGDKIGITDTTDNIEEFYSNREVVNFVHKRLNIYGISVFNNKADCTVLNVNKTINKSELVSLLNNWRKVHNQWTGIPVEDYLAEAKQGTKIVVHYTYRGDGDHRIHNEVTQLVKIDAINDKWKYDDTCNTFSGEIRDSRFAAACLETACIYSKASSIELY